MSRLPSSFTQILYPQFHLGRPSLLSCTTVRVWFLGRFCLFFIRIFQVGLGRILLWAMNTTCFPLNFFSNSRTSRTWISWKDLSWGTGTKIMVAFRPPPTSISLVVVMLTSCSRALTSAFISSSSSTWEMPDLELIRLLPIWLHSLGTGAEHGFILTECQLIKRDSCRENHNKIILWLRVLTTGGAVLKLQPLS